MVKKPKERLIKDFYELKVRQIADKKMWDIPLIKKDEPISHVLSILDGKSHVWVVDNLENKRVEGVITRHDVLKILAPPKKVNYSVFGVPKQYHHGTKGIAEEVMSHDPVTCRWDEKIDEILLRMIRHRVRRLAVIEEDKVVGEITLSQLIHKYYMASQYHPIDEE